MGSVAEVYSPGEPLKYGNTFAYARSRSGLPLGFSALVAVVDAVPQRKWHIPGITKFRLQDGTLIPKAYVCADPRVSPHVLDRIGFSVERDLVLPQNGVDEGRLIEWLGVAAFLASERPVMPLSAEYDS